MRHLLHFFHQQKIDVHGFEGFPQSRHWYLLHGVGFFFYDSWLYLRVLIYSSWSLCSLAQWCIFFQLWLYQLPHQVLMLWITSLLQSSLFLLPICIRSVHCLIHIKQPVDANFCGLFLVSIFPSSWLTLLNKKCSTM